MSMALTPLVESSGGKRARTRAALIEAAAALIQERGYERVSLEAVAAQAGMTRGAIYGNFKNREELFAAVSLDRWRPITPPIQPGVSLKAHLRAYGLAVAAAARERRPLAVHAAAYQLYTLGHEEMRKRNAAQDEAIRRRAVEIMLQAFPRSEFGLPPEQLVRVVAALTQGLLFTYFHNPEGMPDEMFAAAFEALA